MESQDSNCLLFKYKKVVTAFWIYIVVQTCMAALNRAKSVLPPVMLATGIPTGIDFWKQKLMGDFDLLLHSQNINEYVLFGVDFFDTELY